MQFKVVFALAFATFVAAAPPADSSPAKTVTNQGTTLNEVEPPFTVGETIGASKCGSAHLRCCKFHFLKVVIVGTSIKLTTNIGKSTESASDAASFLKTLGYSSAKGPVGLDCTDLPAASAKTWFVSSRSINDLNLTFFFLL